MSVRETFADVENVTILITSPSGHVTLISEDHPVRFKVSTEVDDYVFDNVTRVGRRLSPTTFTLSFVLKRDGVIAQVTEPEPTPIHDTLRAELVSGG